jgi:LacI family transcriptional regulator
MMALPLAESNAERLVLNRLETVLIEIDHPEFTCILIDDQLGGEMAARYLLKKGYRHCAFMGPDELPDYSLNPEESRLAGYRRVYEKYGITFPDEYIKHAALTHPDVHFEFEQWMNLPRPPTAVFAASDDLGIRILRAARESGIRVPEDLAIIGFDDIDMAEQIGLSTVSQSLDESGRMAVELLLGRLENPSRPVQHVQLGLKIIERETA